MRLTLRTLLAYLDDTLDAAEIKAIGQKVGESDAAQELISRIKQVTRRRRLTTPTDGGPGERFDANIVGQYLDNELDAELVTELEKICLDSDVHLAEIAACHQILTLVEGEPALVPPAAKRRMVGLVQGKTAKVAKRPALAPAREIADRPTVDRSEHDSLIDLPLFRRAPWLKWAVPVAALLVLGILGGFLVSNLSGDKDEGRKKSGDRVVTRENPNEKEKPDTEKPPVEKPTVEKPATEKPATEKPATEKPTTEKPATEKPTTEKPTTEAVITDKPGTDKPVTDKPSTDKPVFPPPTPKPSMERDRAGRFESRGEVLVHRAPGDDTWERIAVGGTVNNGEEQVSLPGFKSQVVTDSKVKVILWGHLPQFFDLEALFKMRIMPPPLLESAVTLHSNPAVDLELTLQRGRIYLINAKEKGPARVRLRIWKEEIWDLILENPEDAVAVELWSSYPPDRRFRDGEEPQVNVVLYVVRGSMQAKIEYAQLGKLTAPPGPAMLDWNNKEGRVRGPHRIDDKLVVFDVDQPIPKDAQRYKAAREEIADQMTKPGKTVGVALLENLDSNIPERRELGIAGLSAIDDVKALLDIFGNEEPNKGDSRQHAIIALRNWISRGAENGRRLHDRQKGTGLLIDKKFNKPDATTLLDLLYGIPDEDRARPETYAALIAYLRHDRIEIRELAIRHLIYMVPAGRKIPYFPAGDKESHKSAFNEWKKLIPDGKLPPSPPPPPPMPMP